MWDLAVREEDFEGINAMLARYRGRPPLSMRLVPALARSDSAKVDTLLSEGRTLESRQLQIAARYAASYLENLGIADSLARLDLAWRERPVNRAGAQLLVAGLAAAGGQWSAARQAYRLAETMEGAGPVVVHRAFTALVPMLPVAAEDLRAVRDGVEQWDPAVKTDGTALAAALQPHLRLYLVGMLSNRLGDKAEADRALSALERLGGSEEVLGVSQGLSATLRADIAWSSGRPRDVLAALEGSRGSEQRIPLELVALSRAANLRPYGLEQARYLRAVALSGVGRHTEALAWLRFGFRGSPQEYLYLAPVHVRLGEVFESLSQPDSALAHYNRFLALWTRPDPETASLVEDIRARVGRLKAVRGGQTTRP